jgi:hypothetical protein
MSEFTEWAEDGQNLQALNRRRYNFTKACATTDVRNYLTGRPNLEGSDTQSPATLIGYGAFSLGELWQLRYQDPVASPLLSRLGRRIAGTSPRIIPPPNPTATEESQAFLLDGWFQNMRGGGPNWLGHCLLDVLTFGRHAAEIRVEDSHRGQRLHFFEIAPASQRFITTPDGESLAGISQGAASKGGAGFVDAWKLFFLHNPRAPGDFEGFAELTRPLLAYKLIREAIIKADIAYRQVAKGVPVFRETQPEEAVTGDSSEIDSWVANWMAGNPSPMYVPYGYSPEWFNPPASPPNVIEMLRYLDEQMKRVLLDTLSSLGISATGSRALGGEFANSDTADFSELMASYIVRMNGAGEEYSDLIYILAKTLGIELKGRPPLFILEGLSSIPVSQQISKIREAKEAGIDLEISRRDVSNLRVDIGLGPLEESDTDEYIEDVERIDRDLSILQELGSGILSPEKAASLLSRNGWDDNTARELVQLPPIDLDASEAAAFAHIDRSVTPAMQEAAKRGLALRKKFGRGMQDTGLTTARTILRGGNLSIDQWRLMRAWFERHRQNRNPDDKESDNGPKAGWIAWLGWGGDAADSRAASIMRQVETASRLDGSSSECGCSSCKGERKLFASSEERQHLSNYEGMEKFLDTSTERAVRLIQQASRAHREAFIQQTEGMSPLEIAETTVDYTEVYLAALREVASATRTRAQLEIYRDLVGRGYLPPPRYSTSRHTEEAIEAALLLRARELSDSANDQLRTAGLAVVEDGALVSTETRWSMPPTVAALVAGSAVTYVFMRQQQDLLITASAFAEARASAKVVVTATREVLADGTVITRNADGTWTEVRPGQPPTPDIPGAPQVPTTVTHASRPVRKMYARYRAVMDHNTCEECEALNGRVFVVGSQAYYNALPPNPRCLSAKNLTRGNQCRCHMEVLPADFVPGDDDEVLGDEEND